MSSSVLTREDGLSDMRDGVLIGLRGKPLGLGAILDAPDGVRSPFRFSLVGVCRWGDSGRGMDGLLTRGLGTEGLGPTDLLKLTAGRAGVGGTELTALAEKRLVT